MKNYNGMVYIPNDLLDEILRIPVENEDTENEYWVGQILFAYAALAQKNDKKPTPEELSNFTKKNIDLVNTAGGDSL